MKKYIKIITVIIISILLTGCTKTLKDENNKIVIYEKTGQHITENIICRPTTKDIINLYLKNKIDISKLPECKDFKINSGGYEGLWTSIFFRPLAWSILKIGTLLNNYGLSLIIISLLIRCILYPVTKGTTLQSEKIKKAKPELDAIEKKYSNKNSQEDMIKKGQEIITIYKKYNINPLSGCLFAFLQIPILFAFLEAINRTPAIFEGNLLFFQLGTTPYIALKNGQIQYILLVILLIFITYFSFKINKTPPINVDTQKQMDFMSKVMIVFISFASFTLSTAISIYWITSNLFTIIQNILIRRSKEI